MGAAGTAAVATESRATELLLDHVQVSGLTDRLELVLVDRGTTVRAARAMSRRFGFEVRQVFWPDRQPVFRPIAHAWRVEVAHGLLGRSRRLAKSFREHHLVGDRVAPRRLRSAVAPRAHRAVGDPHSSRLTALSVVRGTIPYVPVITPRDDAAPLVSHAGVPLTRATTFRFTLDVNAAEHQQLLAHAGASRLAFNHHVGRVKANLDQRAAERTYDIAEADLTPSLSWSKVAFINHMNAWKDGRDPTARVNDDGARGLAWRGEVSADVFETASVNAAQALKNWSDSAKGTRSGKKAGFVRFKSRHKTTPAFRLRAKYTEGAAPSVRPTGPKMMRFAKLGELRVRETTKQLRRLYETGRFHAYAASFQYERGRWVVAVTGVAAELHHQRRGPKALVRTRDTTTGSVVMAPRRHTRVGVDLGVKTLAVIADETGTVLAAVEGVKALQHARARLKLANQSYSRTKRDSAGRKKAARRLGRIHARVANVRKALLHELSSVIVKGHAAVVIEDLNAAGMLANRKLARAVSDASFGELRRQIEYKAAWYGTDLTIADRWFPSSKTCSNCGHINPDLTLADRTYECGACGLVLDRDVNAAINLARYTEPAPAMPPLPAAA
jgi:putative transposase